MWIKKEKKNKKKKESKITCDYIATRFHDDEIKVKIKEEKIIFSLMLFYSKYIKKTHYIYIEIYQNNEIRKRDENKNLLKQRKIKNDNEL